MSSVQSIRDLDVSGRRILTRVDLNVPLRDGGITSDARIRAVLPTVRHALEAGASMVLCSHLGRPKGQRKAELTLEPVAARLSELLGVDVILTDDCVGDGVSTLMSRLEPGMVMLLENLRFHTGETKNDPDFVRRLVAPFDLENDVYVNDAFGACHRSHASVVGVAQRFDTRAAGFLLEREVNALLRLIEEPKKPFVAVVGGAKVADKLGILSTLIQRVDALCIGGAMAYTFLMARGIPVGTSRVEEPQLATARDLLVRAENHGVRVYLPIDHVVASEFDESATAKRVGERGIGEDEMGLDIGSNTCTAYADVIASAGTIFWNGPMGVFEWEAFSAGTMAVAAAVAEADAYTVVGGGDSVAAIERANVADAISHVSTGGGASLEFLQHGQLPGLEALRGSA